MKYLLTIVCLCLLTGLAMAQKPTVQRQQVAVQGNCDQCKQRIERALEVKGVKKAVWDAETEKLTVWYRPDLVSLQAIRQRVAAVGHDTDSLPAPRKAYEALPSCCSYRSGGASKH